ncbi:MAG: hypothetical protein JSW04_13315 [Desulfobacterales bacterium]|nr:MAG: hypothetical protein JSW04_13315 [Desulfobacterales bacterium]
MTKTITSLFFHRKKDNIKHLNLTKINENIVSISKKPLKSNQKTSILIWSASIFLQFLFVFVPPALALTQVTLSWDPNSEPDLAGYRAFYREEGASYDYSVPTWEGSETTSTIYGLHETKGYCFVVRAYNMNGLESKDSAEKCIEPKISSSNQAPKADAGPEQAVREGHLVTLDGSSSTDPDDGIASYHWVQTGGILVSLSDPSAEKPTFIAPDVAEEGACLTFELTVIDHNGLQSMDSCLVNVTWQNEPPMAEAGVDQTVNEGVVVTLNGSASLDVDNGIISYLWTQTDGLPIVLSDPSSSQPTFLAPDVGPEGMSLIFNLTVTDNGGLKDTDTCVVNISWQNTPPTAVVEDYLEAYEGDIVFLDGSRSTDPDDGIASFLWTQVNGSPVTLSDPTQEMPTFIAPTTDSYGSNLSFKLMVTDRKGLQGTADCFVYVLPEEESPAVEESLMIIFAKYTRVNKKLVIKAESNSGQGSDLLTAWANYGDDTIKLGELKYIAAKKVYQSMFKKVFPSPDSVTVTNSNGIFDTRQCSIR